MPAKIFDKLGDLKQALTRDYNTINMQLFDVGVVTLKIEFLEEKIFILAIHKRLVSLQRLSQQAAFVSDMADYYLIQAFKEDFHDILVRKYGFDIDFIFKDYDSASERSATIILLKEPVQTYLAQPTA